MLTREYIMNLEAGREMDALIAEKVMNLCVLDHVQGYGDGCVMSDKGFDEWEKHPMFGKCEDPELLSPYSSDISAAFEVVEQLNGKYSFTIQRLGDYFYQDPDYGWEAIFSSYADRKVKADTASLAICRAALLTTIKEQ